MEMKKIICKALWTVVAFALVATFSMMFGNTSKAYSNDSPYKYWYDKGYNSSGHSYYGNEGKVSDYRGGNKVVVTSENVKVEVDYSKITASTTSISKDMLKVYYWDKGDDADGTVYETKDFLFYDPHAGSSSSQHNGVDFSNTNNIDNVIFIYIGTYTIGQTHYDDYSCLEVRIPIEYNIVEFNLNGGNETIDKQVVIKGKKVEEPSTTPTKTATDSTKYYFAGWNTKADGTGNDWNFANDVTKSMTLYAKWSTTPIYKVTFNNQNLGSSVEPQNVGEEQKYRATQPTAPIIGEVQVGTDGYKYTFTGWNTKADGTGTNWDFEDSVVTKDMTLYAQWKKSYKVSFDKTTYAGSEDFSESLKAQYITAADNYRATQPTAPVETTKYTKDQVEYTFAGWNTKADGTGDYWDFADDEVTKDITLYAQWEADRFYTIKYFDGFSTEASYSNITDYVYAVDGNKNAVSNFKGFYILNGDKQVRSSEKTKTVEPTFSRVDYTFEGWFLDNGEHFDSTKTVKENGADDIAVKDNNEYIINLTAKWAPIYKGASAVEIESEKLDDGTYKVYYSDFVDAYAANKAGVNVYRNYILTNKKGQAKGEVDTLPEGLHLNERTGEVYGVPRKVGKYSFYVRLADDEGNWISAVQEISMEIKSRPLDVFLADTATEYEKIYGENDPADLYYGDESIVKVTTSAPNYDTTVNPCPTVDDHNAYRIDYDYATEHAAHYADQFDENTAAVKSQLDKAPDLADGEKTYVPSDLKDMFDVTLHREKGEDAGVYKRFAEINDRAEGEIIANYDVDLGSLKDTNHRDENDEMYSNAHYLIIHQKKVSYYNDIHNRHYIYGELTNGTAIENGTFGYFGMTPTYLPDPDLVRDTEFTSPEPFSGYKINDKEDFKVVDQLAAQYLSNAQMLKAGEYVQPTDEVIDFVTKNEEYSDASDANNATASNITSANYDPKLKLVVYRKPINLKEHKVEVYTNTDVTVEHTKALASLVGVLKKDIVDYVATYVINGTEYATIEEASKALTDLATKEGDYEVTVKTTTLVGDDAENYVIEDSVVATLHVKNAVLMAKAKSSAGKKVTVTWNAVKGAKSYVVYGAQCGKKMKKLAAVKATSKLTYTQKKLKKGNKYRYYVVAMNGNKIVARSVQAHAIVGKKAGKYADAKKITPTKKSVVVYVGKTTKVSAKVKNYWNKKSLVKNHAPKLRFKSADNSIATVLSNGTIKGVKAGTTTVYIQTVNGMWTAVQVTVK